MFELIIIISRYLFLLYMIFFLYHGYTIVMHEHGIIKINCLRALSMQKITVIFFHITAVLILAYIPANFKFDTTKLITGLIMFLFLFFASIISVKVYKGSSQLIWNCVLFITDIGYIMLQRLNPELAFKQIEWYILGFLISLLIPYILKMLPHLDLFKYVYVGIGFVLLLSTLFFGIKEGGATNWIKIKFITFQPSEIVKLLFVFYLSCEFSKKDITIKKTIIPAILSAAFVLCLVFQTDLGSALIFFMTFMVMIYISTSSLFMLFSGIGAASVASVIAYKIFPHIKTRVSIWINPWNDINYSGYQIVQSLFAIGTYGLFGSGLTKGYSGYIPVVERDFIFSAVCEEFGVLFGIGLIAVFLLIYLKCVKISLKSESRFFGLISAGLTSLMSFQTFLIIGGVTKLIPLTGVTLPFVSYGGSSIFISFITIGVLQWVCTRNYRRAQFLNDSYKNNIY